ncbi:hypothetical protein I547_3923 [Mycobacterium kansasii 824]|uniref:Uncharacterized protein n=1 Tax=Mycobacterium kansasii TaxID=1768 RepID=A0A1V3XGU9_MYCKA|nr:hypothetical protein I547_3923 [Mycobacterium kansasii 824]OOK78444.1 hypothetical protein BZL30_2198 [Mycobacterium kansasii]
MAGSFLNSAPVAGLLRKGSDGGLFVISSNSWSDLGPRPDRAGVRQLQAHVSM